ncbi:hypothetical protein ABLE68_18415 [Nocardioides sp. CN2-186]|uniref:hypothetical protein n=1 Tax=Nocardioides tweenelious TaxID=3156607 RepID=UPI0032B40C70
MTPLAAGEFRRTTLERSDQQASWERPDQAFFAAGACHILAWACRDVYASHDIELGALRRPDQPQVFHTFATWGWYAFDHAGWNLESELVEANAAYEKGPVSRVAIDGSLADFCGAQAHRMPHEFWADPMPRARAYVARFRPPWS